jgi:hypothetical protein
MKTAATDGGAVESSSTSGIDRISMNVHDCQDLLGKFKHYIPPLAGTPPCTHRHVTPQGSKVLCASLHGYLTFAAA